MFQLKQPHEHLPRVLVLLVLPGLLATAAQGPLWDNNLLIGSAAALPCKAGPPIWSNPRSLSTGSWTSQSDAVTRATRIIIRHAPIPGVTPTMMVWLLQNMDKVVPDPRFGPGKGQDHQV